MKKQCFIVGIALFLMLFSFSGCSEDLRKVKIAYACQNELNDKSPDSAISYVEKKVFNTTRERLYLLTLQLALYDPEIEGLISPFPEGTLIRDIKLDENSVANVMFSDEYSSLDGMSKTLADACTMYTLIQFPEIEYVTVCAENDPENKTILKDENRITDISDLRQSEYDLIFYFPNDDQSALTPVKKKIVISESDSLTQSIIENLIMGYRFDTGYRRHISQYTECFSAKIKSRICYVDFNDSFLDINKMTADGISLTVYSVVNTLCQLEDVDKVQIMINGNIFDFAMNTDLSKPLEPDYRLNETYDTK